MTQDPALQRTESNLLRAALAGVWLGLVASLAAAATLGTVFTYQGVLKDDMGAPETGSFDFSFELYDDELAGSQVGPTVTKPAVTVTDGLLIVELDFGAVFDGRDLWLEIAIRDAGGVFQALDPRQHLTAAPYALFGQDSDTLDGMDSSEFATPAELDADIATHAGLLDAHHTPTVDTDTVLTEAEVEAFVTNGPLDGSNLTNLNASNLSTGTVAEARVADEIARDAEVPSPVTHGPGNRRARSCAESDSAR